MESKYVIAIVVAALVLILVIVLVVRKDKNDPDGSMSGNSIATKLKSFQTQIATAIRTENNTQLVAVTKQVLSYIKANKSNIISQGTNLGWNNPQLQPMYNITDIVQTIVSISNQILKGGYPSEIPGFLNGQLGQAIFEITNPCPNPIPGNYTK